MKVLYLGVDAPGETSLHRARALARLGHQVVHCDPYAPLRKWRTRWQEAVHYRTGYVLFSPWLTHWLSQLSATGHTGFDVVWVDNGELFGPSHVAQMRRLGDRVVLFNHDDPTGSRDGARFMSMRRAIASYDLCVVVRHENVREFRSWGARDVIRVWMGHDEVEHAPSTDFRFEGTPFDSDVAFIGTNIPGEGRDQHLVALIAAGVNVALWGRHWEQSPLWSRLAPHWRGSSLSGRDYVHAIQGARVCLGMLSRGNRDRHTTRTMEIPYATGLLCAQRTDEHLALYQEGVEAVFWDDVDECVEACRSLLRDPERVLAIKQAGHRRVLLNRVGNEDIGRQALARVACQEVTHAVG